MKRLILIIAGILLVSAGLAMAQDPGLRDSLIVDTVSINYYPNGAAQSIRVWFVTDDSVMVVFLPFTWNSVDGLVYPGHAVWKDGFATWDTYDTLLITERLFRLLAYTGSSNQVLYTSYTRLNAMDLRFVAMPGAVSQLCFIDTIYDPRNGSCGFGGPNGDWDLTPAFRRGFFRYGIEGINDENTNIPREFALEQNYPNPFNPETNINFKVPTASNVSIQIFNVLGQNVKDLVNEYKNSGTYTVLWNGTNESGQTVPSGVYFYRMVAGDFSHTNKMIMLR